jgi:galactokinase
VNLIGEHTDYAGGLVLPVAIDRGITLDCRPAAAIRLRSDAVPASGFADYVAALEAELADRGRAPAGIEGEIASDLPVGAGLASSAALLVAVGLALCAAGGLELEPMDLAQACRAAEQRAVGVPCGIMDPAASLLGRAGHAVLLDCATLEHRTVPLPAGLGVLVIDSGVRRRLAATAYSDRRAELGRARSGATDPVSLRRRRHFESENARVRAAVAALDRGDTAALGPILAAGHASLRDDYEVSTPELDLMVDLAVDAGATAARMTGGGFGGAIVVLAPHADCERIGAEVARAYRERTGRDATPLVARAADGATKGV